MRAKCNCLAAISVDFIEFIFLPDDWVANFFFISKELGLSV